MTLRSRARFGRAILLLLAALVLPPDARPSSPSKSALSPGARRPIAFAALKRGFAQPDRLYAPFAFWFWDAPLDPARAAYQAEEMLKQGFNPGYAHPRAGLPAAEWLSPKWFAALEAARKRVAAAGGSMGYCDEYDWPSGRAGGRVLAKHPELRALSLRWDVRDVPGGQAAALPASFFTVAAQTGLDGRIRSRTLRVLGAGAPFAWNAPPGAWRVFTFTQYHHPGLDGSPVNYLDDNLMPAFMSIAYKPYERYLGRPVRKGMAGLFVDNEGDYGWKLAWSDHLARVYRQRTGRDIRLWMPLLVERDAEGTWARARWEWMDVVSDVYASNFFGQINRWCAERGMYCTMHVWEESLQLQAEAVGDYFKVMRAVSMPGTDSLVRKPLEPQEFKETQSVSEFEGRRFCSEVLGVVGWDMPPALLKQTTNALTAWGVSHVMPHGVYLRPELNTIPYPPDFFIENPYWPYFHLWTDFTRRTSYVTSHGRTVPDVLLLNPMDSLWATMGEWLLAPQDETVRQVQQINAVYFDALRRLADARVEYLVTDRHYLRQMQVKPGGTLTRGPFTFRAVVLPPMVVLPRDVARKLVAFAKAGGAVYVLGDLPAGSAEAGMGDPAMRALMDELRAQPSVRDCRAGGLTAELARPGTRLASRVAFESGAFPMLQSHRRIDGRDFLWLANNGEERRECTLIVRGVRGAASRWDCETGAVTPLASTQTAQGSRLKLAFRPLDGFFVVFDPSARPNRPASPRPSAPARVVRLDGPWNVQIPRAGQPGLTPETAKLFTVPWKASWLRVEGATRLRQAFDLPEPPEKARLWVTADESFRLYVNGHAVARQPGDGVWQQVTVLDVTRRLRRGRNVLAASARKPGGSGGFLLQGEVRMRNGRTAALATGPAWRVSPDDDAPETLFGRWIWLPEARPNQTACFRRAFDLPPGANVRRAPVVVTADNRFTLYVNGRRVGAGEPWMTPGTWDVARLLRPGRNVLAVEAQNDDGAAGLLAGLRVETTDGRTVRVATDEDWRVSPTESGAWQSPDYDDAGWETARVVGEYGAAPWGRFDEEALRGVPAWADPAFVDAGWTAAETAGRPGDAPWRDVPPELLAGAVRPLEPWLAWGLDRFTGYVDYATTFRASPAGGRVALDLGRVKHVVEVWVNGQRVGARLWPPFVFDITPYARPGVNTVRVRVGNLMTNEMGQFADRNALSTWGWGPAPARESFDAGLLGPVTVRVEGSAGAPAGRRAGWRR